MQRAGMMGGRVWRLGGRGPMSTPLRCMSAPPLHPFSPTHAPTESRRGPAGAFLPVRWSSGGARAARGGRPRDKSQAPIFRSDSGGKGQEPGSALQRPDEEMAYENDKRKTYSLWVLGGLVQLGVLMLASNIYINIKRMRSNLGHLEGLKARLTTLETQEALTADQILEKERLESELNSAQRKISFWELSHGFGLIDWFFVIGTPLLGAVILVVLRRRIGRMTAKIEILRRENAVRFWVYDGPLVRKLAPVDVPMSQFPHSDVDIPRDTSMFRINVPGVRTFYIEQAGARFGDRARLMRILNGQGASSTTSSATKDALRNQFQS